MRTNSRLISRAVAAAVLSTGVACGGESDATPRTGKELATMLAAPADLDGEWTIHQAPDEVDLSGEVTDETRDLLPSFELCPAASEASRAAARDIPWKAFAQLDLTVTDSFEPPFDPTGHIVFVQEFLTSGTVDDMSTTFDLLRDGLESCLGDIPADEEGAGVAMSMDVPSLGDERYAVLEVIAEAGGGAEWRLHNVLVRDGTTLASVMVAEIRSVDVDPQLSVTDVGEIAKRIIDASR